MYYTQTSGNAGKVAPNLRSTEAGIRVPCGRAWLGVKDDFRN